MAPLLTVPLTLSIYISRRRSGCCWRLRGDGGVTSVQRTGSCGAAVRRCRVSPRVVTVAGLDTSTSPHPARATRRTRAAAVSYTLTRFCTPAAPCSCTPPAAGPAAGGSAAEAGPRREEAAGRSEPQHGSEANR